MSEQDKRLNAPPVRNHYEVFVDVERGRLVLQDFSTDGHVGSNLLLALMRKVGFKLDIQTDSPCG